MNSTQKQPFIIDCHQDIALACLYTTRTNFFDNNSLHSGSNEIGLPVNNQSDFPRLKKGNVRMIFSSVCPFTVQDGSIIVAADTVYETKKQLSVYEDFVKQSLDIFFVRSAQDLKKLQKDKLGMLLHLEGADMLKANPKYIKDLYEMGFRSLGLTWNFDNGLAGGAMSEGHLSKTGMEIIAQMEKLGMIVDLAHLNEVSALEVLAVIKRPCFISHTNCAAVFQHRRCVSDDVMKKTSDVGGIVCISGVPSFVGENPSLDALCDHILHAVKVCGIDHVGLGSDFSVMTEEKLIQEFEDVTCYSHLANNLAKRGLTLLEVEKIFNKNIYHFISSIL